MFSHGAMRYRPTANVVYQTACASLETYRRAARVKRDLAYAKAEGVDTAAWKANGTLKTAFLAAHVRRAARPSDVLRNAIMGIYDGQKAKSFETRIVYSSLAALQAALEIALQNEGQT